MIGIRARMQHEAVFKKMFSVFFKKSKRIADIFAKSSFLE
jgi:hypothetical protein